MMKGQIVKGIAGFYFVKSGETICRCRARGLFKKQGMKLLVLALALGGLASLPLAAFLNTLASALVLFNSLRAFGLK